MTPSSSQNQHRNGNSSNGNGRSLTYPSKPSSTSNQKQKKHFIEGTFTSLPNKVWESLYDMSVCPCLTRYERGIFDFIIRITYGWQRNYARITYEEFMKATKITDKRNFNRSLDSLIDKGMILKKGEGKGKPIYYIQTSPDKLYPNIRTTFRGLDFWHDVTIRDFSKPTEYGLGALLKQAGKLPAATGAVVQPIKARR